MALKRVLQGIAKPMELSQLPKPQKINILSKILVVLEEMILEGLGDDAHRCEIQRGFFKLYVAFQNEFFQYKQEN